MTEFSDLPAALSPRQALDVVAPPRLWDGDDPAGYELLQERVSDSLGPKDFLEEIWTRDVVDLVWEIFRLRRIKSDLMREGAYKGVLKVLNPRFSLLAKRDRHDPAQKWASGDPNAAAAVDRVLATCNLTMDAVRANTFSALIDNLECIDRMTMMAEGRRDTILREIDRHREQFARRLRRVIDDVEDAEFKVIATDEAKPPARRETQGQDLSREGAKGVAAVCDRADSAASTGVVQGGAEAPASAEALMSAETLMSAQ